MQQQLLNTWILAALLMVVPVMAHADVAVAQWMEEKNKTAAKECPRFSPQDIEMMRLYETDAIDGQQTTESLIRQREKLVGQVSLFDILLKDRARLQRMVKRCEEGAATTFDHPEAPSCMEWLAQNPHGLPILKKENTQP
jgi:hypothetical protein